MGRGERELSLSAGGGREKTNTRQTVDFNDDDVDEEEEDFSFSKQGRVNRILERRKVLLAKVEKLGFALEKDEGYAVRVGDVGFSCETALQFYRYHVVFRIERYRKLCRLMSRLFKRKEASKRQRQEEKKNRVEEGLTNEEEEEERRAEEEEEEDEELFWRRVEKVFSDLAIERGSPVRLRLRRAQAKGGQKRAGGREEAAGQKQKKDEGVEEQEAADEEKEEEEEKDVTLREEKEEEERGEEELADDGSLVIDPVVGRVSHVRARQERNRAKKKQGRVLYCIGICVHAG